MRVYIGFGADTRSLTLLHLGQSFSRFLHILRKVVHLLDLADFDHLVIAARATLGPFDGFGFGVDLDQPEAAEYFLRFREWAIRHEGLAALERDARAH